MDEQTKAEHFESHFHDIKEEEETMSQFDKIRIRFILVATIRNQTIGQGIQQNHQYGKQLEGFALNESL